ncbi:iron transporter [Pistricoccus aurantiacus]|uniref:iron transporter n=1 Tax=Pistricoccus aurantiacus TaxID=1883414 RepID=UPI0036269232
MKRLALAALPLVAIAGQALALEYPIGEPKLENGMEIAAVYLQPVTMEPAGELPAAQADIHLEADIHALEDNPNGFAPGAWIPYLEIDYRLTKEGSDTPIEGSFMPMMANDGTHYGANVKLDGPGKYHLTYTVKAPQLQRHIDKETGVPEWYDTFEVDYDFVYAGTGKKGGY